MTNDNLLGGETTHAVAEDIDLFDAEVLHEGGNVVGQLLVGEWAIDISRAAVALHFESDYLPRLGQGRHQRPEHVDGPEGPVENDERYAATAMNLVVHPQPVDRRVAGFNRRWICDGRGIGRLCAGPIYRQVGRRESK